MSAGEAARGRVEGRLSKAVRHARSAIGAQQLPGGIPVEIEMILEVEE